MTQVTLIIILILNIFNNKYIRKNYENLKKIVEIKKYGENKIKKVIFNNKKNPLKIKIKMKIDRLCLRVFKSPLLISFQEIKYSCCFSLKQTNSLHCHSHHPYKHFKIFSF